MPRNLQGFTESYFTEFQQNKTLFFFLHTTLHTFLD